MQRIAKHLILGCILALAIVNTIDLYKVSQSAVFANNIMSSEAAENIFGIKDGTTGRISLPENETTFNMTNFGMELQNFFNTTKLLLTGSLKLNFDWEYTCYYTLVEIVINVCILGILFGTFIAVVFDKYTCAWVIKNVLPFVLLFFPFGWVAFRVSGLETLSIEYYSDGLGKYNYILEGGVKYFNEYVLFVFTLIYHIIELAVRLMISKKILAWAAGSLSILIGLKLGIRQVGIESKDPFWKKLASIIAFAQLPIFLLVLGILYQIIPSWQIALIIASMLLSRGISHFNFNPKVSIYTDLITCIFAIWYAFVCKEHLYKKFHFDLDLLSVGLNYAFSFVLNYLLTVETFGRLFIKIKDLKDAPAGPSFDPLIELPDLGLEQKMQKI